MKFSQPFDSALLVRSFHTAIFAMVVLGVAPSAKATPAFYVSAGDTIDKVDSSGVVTLFANVPNGSNAQGLAVDGGGNLYVSEFTTDQISKISPNGTVSLFATLPVGSGPVGLAFDSVGFLYVAEGKTNQISKINSIGGVSLFTTVPGGFGAQGLAFDASGNLYVADQHFRDIKKVTPGGPLLFLRTSLLQGRLAGCLLTLMVIFTWQTATMT